MNSSSTIANRRASGRRFYAGVAIGTALIVFVGFARTYYLKVLFGTPELQVLLHVHGLVMTTWFVLFFVQVRLVAVHRTDLHRRLGVGGTIVAGLVLVLSTMVVLNRGHLHFVENPTSSEILLFLPVALGVLLLFGFFVTAGILLRARTDYHKRLMTLACLSILSPAIDRLPLHSIENAGQLTLFGLNDLCIVICLVFDTLKNRRLHAAGVWGTALVIGLQILTLLIRHTTVWLRIAEWMLR
jgi:hypothetical protein